MLDWLSHSSIDEIKNLFAHVAVIYYLRIFPSSGIGLVGNLRIASKLFLKKMRKKQNREVRACGFLSLAPIIKKCAKYEVWACGLSNIWGFWPRKFGRKPSQRHNGAMQKMQKANFWWTSKWGSSIGSRKLKKMCWKKWGLFYAS